MAKADRRIFGFTYPYMTIPRGAREIEYYLDVGILTDADVTPEGLVTDEPLTDTRPAFRHQLEFEYGITDRLDLGFYNVLQQNVGEPLEYKGIKLRSRYRFAEEGDLPVDLGIYGEVGYFGDEIEIEERFIVAKRIGRIEIDFNLKLEEEFEREVVVEDSLAKVETEFVFGLVPSLGIGYHFRENIAAGVELAPEIEFGDEVEVVSAFGPTVSFTGNGFWWTIAGQYRVHSEEPSEPTRYKDGEILVRSLFAIIL